VNLLMNHWEKHCEHCWNRTILAEGPDGTMGRSAEVLIVQKSHDFLLRAHPDYLGKWVYLCWEGVCGAMYIGAFDTADAAMRACEKHIESDHMIIFWSDGTETITEGEV
jgi:hypothetical protein